MNIKIISATVLGLALLVSSAAAQDGFPNLLPGYAGLFFDGAAQIGPTDYTVQCGTCCNLVAEYYVPTTDFAILVGAYDPGLPLVLSVLCTAPLPASQCVSMGGVIPPGFSGCCFAFIALGIGPKGIPFSDTMILHIN